MFRGHAPLAYLLWRFKCGRWLHESIPLLELSVVAVEVGANAHVLLGVSGLVGVWVTVDNCASGCYHLCG